MPLRNNTSLSVPVGLQLPLAPLRCVRLLRLHRGTPRHPPSGDERQTDDGDRGGPPAPPLQEQLTTKEQRYKTQHQRC